MNRINSLFARAVLAFVALPGMVAFAIPLLLLRPENARFDTRAFVPLVVGLTLLLWCVWHFYASGKGTLAPWSPPKHLVAIGPYRYSRNPMYVAVFLVLIGWAIAFRSLALTIYAVAVMSMFHLRVVFGEEPWLARTHGDEWTRYKVRVRRWL